MEVQFSRTPRGRPRYRPTEADRATVKLMVAAGLQHNVIRTCLAEGGISLNTMHHHFASELKTSDLLVSAIATSQVAKAVNKGEPWAIKFWLTRRSGVKPTRSPEATGVDGAQSTNIHIRQGYFPADTRRSAGKRSIALSRESRAQIAARNQRSTDGAPAAAQMGGQNTSRPMQIAPQSRHLSQRACHTNVYVCVWAQKASRSILCISTSAARSISPKIALRHVQCPIL